MSRSARLIPAADAVNRAYVALPLTMDGGDATISLPVAGLVPERAIPLTLSAEWCTRHGLKAEPGSSTVLRSLQGPAVILVSVGSSYNNAESWRLAGAAIARAAGDQSVAVGLPSMALDDPVSMAQALVEGALLASYNFKKPEGKGAFDVVALGDPLPTIDVHNRVQHGVDAGALVADAINWAKRLIDTPAAALTPKEMAKQIATRLENDPAVSVEIWNESKIKDERLGGLLAVGQGSDEPVRVAYATYQPAGSETWPHIALVGKGITFDSGGLSLKTYEGMLTMKTDMSGAAIVMAALSLAARMKLSVRLTAIALMSENLTGGSAQKPGDVFTARNGMTVEVLNTDAEGRLVLADGLSLAAEVKPDAIVDVATLTGAARIALGDEMAAYMASTDEVARSFESAAARAGEDVWRLPLYDKYASHLDSEVADMKNIGKAGNAGTIVAGLFLQKFVGNTPWVHLDMAAPGRADAAKGYWTKGATAFGARAIVEFLRGVAAE